MANKEKIKKVKKANWKRIVLWVFGIIFGIWLAFTIGFRVWVSTWKVYDRDGFILRVPVSWDVKYLTESSTTFNSPSKLLFVTGDKSMGNNWGIGINKNWNGNFWLMTWEYPKPGVTLQEAVDSLKRNSAPGLEFSEFYGNYGLIKYSFTHSSNNESGDDLYGNSYSSGIFFQEGQNYVCEYVVHDSKNLVNVLFGDYFIKTLVANSKCN